MTMTSAAYDAIIAEILGGYEKPEAPEEKPKGLGAMTSRAGMKMPDAVGFYHLVWVHVYRSCLLTKLMLSG